MEAAAEFIRLHRREVPGAGPAEPRLRLWINGQVRDPELEEVVEGVGHLDRDDRADLGLGGGKIARDQELHEPK